MSPTVLVVEDDPTIATTMVEALESAALEVTLAEDGPAALRAVDALPIDLVLLDLGLPGLDGREVCQRIRDRSAVPVFVVTARGDSTEIVDTLELGADDYLVKPFDSDVLVARARALLRRYGDDVPRVRTARDLTVDEPEQVASQGGTPLDLTRIELSLLAELVRSAGQALSRQTLLERVWGHGYLGDSRLVDMAIKRLRDKLGEAPEEPPYISTIRGVGYRFNDDPALDGLPAEPGTT